MEIDKITINKDIALATVKSNLESHINDFNIAISGYKIKLANDLSKNISKMENIKTNIENMSKDELSSIGPFFGCHAKDTIPVSHEDDYNRVIKMMEMTSDNFVVFSSVEFGNYILDEWKWKKDFSLAVSGYSSYIH